MKQNKNKINEGALDVGITSYKTSTNTSNTTSRPNTSGVNVNVKKKDLSDPSLQQNISKLKNANVNVVDESSNVDKMKLEYLSEIEDSSTGEVSKPFTIKNKKYQVVRATTPDRQIVTGIYSLEEVDADGNNLIYAMDDFEKMIKEPEQSKTITDGEEEKTESRPSFAGFKHYIVNKKTGKARKFKNIEELAKANMTEDEQYMGIKDFKKYVDEVLFGSGKRQVKEMDVQQQTQQTNVNGSTSQLQQKMIASAEKLMNLIKTKIPANVIQQIKNNHIAQREVILAFADLIGVPNNEINKIILGVKDMSRNNVNVNENTRIIKVKDLK